MEIVVERCAFLDVHRDTAEMAKGRMRAKIPELADALAGRFNPHHALLCRAMLARIDQADATIAELTARIVELQDPHEAAVTLLVGIPGVRTRVRRMNSSFR